MHKDSHMRGFGSYQGPEPRRKPSNDGAPQESTPSMKD
jgi:hypothetical protein